VIIRWALRTLAAARMAVSKSPPAQDLAFGMVVPREMPSGHAKESRRDHGKCASHRVLSAPVLGEDPLGTLYAFGQKSMAHYSVAGMGAEPPGE